MSLNTGNAILSNAITVDSSYKVGIGISTPTAYLMVKGDGGSYNQLRLAHSTDGYFDIGVSSTVANLIANYNTTAIPMAFYTGASMRMIIGTTGNVGIGTSSPSYLLDLSNSGNARVINIGGATTGYQYLNWANTGASLLFGIENSVGGGLITGGSAYSSVISTQNATNLLLGTNNTIRMTITSAGNVGIGTSSTGFNAAGLPLVVGSGSGNTGLTIFSGASSSGSIHFADTVTTGGGSYSGFLNYDHAANSMQFGTTNTEAMRISSNGAVCIGGTYNSANFSVAGVSASIGLIDSSATGNGDKTVTIIASKPGVGYNNLNYNAYVHSWFIGGGQSQAMQINSIGDICAMRNVTGVAVSSYKNFSFGAAGFMARDAYDSYITGNIYYDGAWKLKYSGYYGNVINTYSGEYSFLRSNASSPADTFVSLTATFYIDYNGNIVSKGSLTQNGSPSDINLKENLVKISSPLEKLLQINGYHFDWKKGTPSNGLVIPVEDGMQTPESPLAIVHDAGLIAQEVEAIMPELVRESGHKSLNYNGIIALLVEAIKEQQIQIEELKAKIK